MSERGRSKGIIFFITVPLSELEGYKICATNEESVRVGSVAELPMEKAGRDTAAAGQRKHCKRGRLPRRPGLD